MPVCSDADWMYTYAYGYLWARYWELHTRERRRLSIHPSIHPSTLPSTRLPSTSYLKIRPRTSYPALQRPRNVTRKHNGAYQAVCCLVCCMYVHERKNPEAILSILILILIHIRNFKF